MLFLAASFLAAAGALLARDEGYADAPKTKTTKAPKTKTKKALKAKAPKSKAKAPASAASAVSAAAAAAAAAAPVAADPAPGAAPTADAVTPASEPAPAPSETVPKVKKSKSKSKGGKVVVDAKQAAALAKAAAKAGALKAAAEAEAAAAKAAADGDAGAKAAVEAAVLALVMPRFPDEPLPGNFARRTCPPNAATWRLDRADPAEKAVMSMLREKATEFAAHLGAKHPDHPFTKRLLETWNGEIRVSIKDTGASFNRVTGCLIVNPYKGAVPPDTVATDARLLTRLLHELAHSWHGPHEASFYDAQRWYLRVATEELGWECAVNCRVCCGDATPGGCVTAACPKCIWQDLNPDGGCKTDGEICKGV